MGYFVEYCNKWWTFSASVLVELCFGSAYCFPLWGPIVKSTYNLSQGQLEFIGSSANVAGCSAILSGLLYDSLERHKRVGPRLVLLVGLAFNVTGYFGLWMAVSGRFEASLGQLAVLAALAANGGTWPDTTVMVTNVRNFPFSRGSVVAALKAAVGLSGSFFACIYAGLFAPAHAPAFLLFLALFPVGIALLALPLINHCSFVQLSETEAGQGAFTTERRFNFTLQVLAVMAVFLITTTTLASTYTLTHAQCLAMTAGAGLLLLPLLLVPWGSGGLLSKRAHLHQPLAFQSEEKEEEEEEAGMEEGAEGREAEAGVHGWPSGDPELAAGPGAAGGGILSGNSSAGGRRGLQKSSGGGLEQPLLSDSAGLAVACTTSAAAAPAGLLPVVPAPAVPLLGAKEKLPELSPLQCLRDADFWLLFAVGTIGTGSGLTLLNNLAQVVAALSGATRATPVLLSLFGVCNCAGRMLLGHIPERALHRHGTPRLLFLPYVSALTSAAFLALALSPLPALYPLVALAGFAYGGHWALIPALTSELFGLRRFAANYALLLTAPAVGSFSLAMCLASWQYQRAIARHGDSGHTCLGQDCFQLTFLVLAALGVCSSGCGVVLYRRRRGLYRVEYRQLHTYDEETHRRES